MSTYIPYTSRNKEGRKPAWKIDEEKRETVRLSQLIPTETNFPTLPSSAPKKVTIWGGERSFSALASEWKEVGDEQKEAEERERRHQVRMNAVVPRFYKIQPLPEENIEEEAKTAATPYDEWTVVSKKARAPKDTSLEQMDKDYEKELLREESNSMWNDQPRDHETYWDEHRG